MSQKKTIDLAIEECQRLAETLKKKNEDYGDSFSKQFEKYGITSSMIRIEDKFNRLNNLVPSGKFAQVTTESIEDTLRDLAGYCILSLAEIKRKQV